MTEKQHEGRSPVAHEESQTVDVRDYANDGVWKAGAMETRKRSEFQAECKKGIFQPRHHPVRLHFSKSPSPSLLAYYWLRTNSSSLYIPSSPAPQNFNGCLASITNILEMVYVLSLVAFGIERSVRLFERARGSKDHHLQAIVREIDVHLPVQWKGLGVRGE